MLDGSLRPAAGCRPRGLAGAEGFRPRTHQKEPLLARRAAAPQRMYWPHTAIQTSSGATNRSRTQASMVGDRTSRGDEILRVLGI